MKRNIYLFVVSVALLMIGCVNKQQSKTLDTSSNNQDTLSAYHEMYKDSFDILIHSLPYRPLTKVDTMYTEMYIALKATAKDKRSATMVIQKVDSLMILDSIKANQVDYLNCKQIALTILGRKKEAFKLGYAIFNLYPENSYERLVSLGSYYITMNQKDSANYYLEKSLSVARTFLKSNSAKVQTKGAVSILTSLVMLGRDTEAKVFIKERLNSRPSADEKEMLNDADRDFGGLKKRLLAPIEEGKRIMMEDDN